MTLFFKSLEGLNEYLEVYFMIFLVPVVNIGHDHPSTCNRNPLVGVSVDHIHLDNWTVYTECAGGGVC